MFRYIFQYTLFSAKYGKNVRGISSKAHTYLEQAAWPGNIRQLRSTVQTAVALATTDKLEIKDFLGIYLEFARHLYLYGTRFH